jgi:hypothetical protein
LSQLVALQQLRAALDQAIEHLEPLVPVLEIWTASRAAQEPQEHSPEPAGPPVPAVVPSSDSAPEPLVPGLFDPLPRPEPRRRPGNGQTWNSAQTTNCHRCGAPVEQQTRGARRKFCGTTCRAKAKAERTARREADPDLEPLPDQVERPFTVFEYPDDARSDPTLLQPPALDWEREGSAP